MCPVTPGPPPGEGGLRCHHVSHGSRLVAGGLWRRGVSYGTGSTSQQGRALVSCGFRPGSRCRRAVGSPRATWLSACYGTQAKGKYSAGLLTQLGPPACEAYLCVLKTSDIRLIMTSPGTRSRQHIKCVQDSHT
jgi:hypothetical protein